jgi:DNA-3-methyladenine glycosylase I
VEEGSAALLPGPDGRPRCWWAVGTSDNLTYHDEEWGRPVTSDDGLFERLALEAFQSGLSWLTILRKREAFREAFDGFRIEAVADFGAGDIERLMGDVRIVRNRRKIEAAIANAQAAREILAAGGEGAFGRLVWSFAPASQGPPRERGDLAATTAESGALSAELKSRGFRFVGPTTAYALMQACGLVNDHLDGCVVRAEVERERRTALDRAAR